MNAPLRKLKVMSYNIKYANENDGENSWSNRKDHLTALMKFYEPHIFGVQEALFEQLEHFDKILESYDYVGAGRNDGKQKGEFTAIFYKGDTFEVLEQHTFWLSETPGEPSKGWDAAYPRICTYGLFKEKDSEEKFWVFNTHFDHRGDDARKKSAELILQKIDEVNDEDLPVIMMGDLNLEPDTEPIKLLTENLTDSKKAAEEVVFGPEGTFNAYEFDKPVTRRIDYIFTNEHVKVLKYAALSDSKDLRYPSDHFPLFAELIFC